MFSNKTLLTKRQHTLFGAWIVICKLLVLEIIENQGRRERVYQMLFNQGNYDFTGNAAHCSIINDGY